VIIGSLYPNLLPLRTGPQPPAAAGPVLPELSPRQKEWADAHRLLGRGCRNGDDVARLQAGAASRQHPYRAQGAHKGAGDVQSACCLLVECAPRTCDRLAPSSCCGHKVCPTHDTQLVLISIDPEQTRSRRNIITAFQPCSVEAPTTDPGGVAAAACRQRGRAGASRSCGQNACGAARATTARGGARACSAPETRTHQRS
jgi:hypothetical protein